MTPFTLHMRVVMYKTIHDAIEARAFVPAQIKCLQDVGKQNFLIEFNSPCN